MLLMRETLSFADGKLYVLPRNWVVSAPGPLEGEAKSKVIILDLGIEFRKHWYFLRAVLNIFGMFSSTMNHYTLF